MVLQKSPLLLLLFLESDASYILCIPQKETYHTHLAVLYLDAVLQLKKKENVKKEELDIAR